MKPVSDANAIRNRPWAGTMAALIGKENLTRSIVSRLPPVVVRRVSVKRERRGSTNNLAVGLVMRKMTRTNERVRRLAINADLASLVRANGRDRVKLIPRHARDNDVGKTIDRD